MPELSARAWTLLAIAALSVGISKAALPGAGTLSVALFAAVMPAKQSTGALLTLLLVGNALALLIHGRYARWRNLLPLVPTVLVGLALGAGFLAIASDAWTRRVIGIILLLVVVATLWWRGKSSTEVATGRLAAASQGTLGGFTTMVANAAGPVMSMYFLTARFPMREFLGTAAWFFACINLAKLPFSIGLGIIDAHTLLLDLTLVPAVVIGAFAGKIMLGWISQATFDRIVIILTVAGAVYLLILCWG